MIQKYTGFVTEIDQFLQKYDKEHPKLSESQKKEIQKFQRIYRLRDDANAQNEGKSLDDWFDKNE